MTPDTTMEWSIPVKKGTMWDRKVYHGWLVKSKEVGFFFSTDPKWATKQEAIRNEKQNEKKK